MTDRYRRQVTFARNGVLADILKIWPLLDMNDLDGSWPALRRALEALLAQGRTRISGIAADYLQAVKELELGSTDVTLRRVDEINEVALRASLLATGPITAKQAIGRGLDVEAASLRALVAVSGVATRVLLGAGRETILDSVDADRDALGWMRVTHGKTCAFCAMLASRGPVYKTRRSAGDPRGRPARFHDHCDCTVEPVFSSNPSIPESSLRFEELWSRTSGRLSGADARNAFRVAYEATL